MGGFVGARNSGMLAQDAGTEHWSLRRLPPTSWLPAVTVTPRRLGWTLAGSLPESLAAVGEAGAATPGPCSRRAICTFFSGLSGSCLRPCAGL